MAHILVLMLLAAGGPSRNVEAKEIRDVVERFVQAAYAESGQQYAIEFRNLPSRVLNIPDQGRLQVVSTPGLTLRGSVLLPVEVFADGHVVHTFLVSAKIRTFGTILTARQKVEKHLSCAAISVSQCSGETTNLPPDAVNDTAALEGRRSKRIIRAGEVLTLSMFEARPLLNPGNAVTLIVKANNVTIKTNAIVRESGGQGDIVLVQKGGRGDRLKARVVDKQTVELIAQH
ncbi:MAG: flagellar basal body P-ring formation protein FlgA [Ignavibacteriae bacterium]|nr:flagellar basal body P-ring formation protein FlgA [Ignavibacteriota bacterium]